MSRADREIAALWNENARRWVTDSRAGLDIVRDYVNTPAFVESLPAITGCVGLDLGCGDGHHARIFSAMGASMTGVDVSEAMLDAARAMEAQGPAGIQFVQASARATPFPDATFDFVTSLMALQNMADNAEVVAEAWRVLRPGGFFQFSIPHPCFFTRMYRVELGHDGHAVSVHVGGYFDPPWGEEVDWKFVSPGVFETRSRTHPRRDDTARRFLRALSRGLRLPAYGRTPSRKSEPDGRTFATFRERRYSRTLGDWLGLLLETGFTLERVVEPCPSDDAVRKHPELTLGRHQAFALIVRSRKPS